MPETFIDYKKKNVGFGISEAFLEILSNFICQVFEEKGLTGKPEWYLEIYEDFDFARKGYNQGFLVFLLEDYLTDAQKEEEFIKLIKAVKIKIQSKGSELKIQDLNSLEKNKADDTLKHKWTKPIKTKDFVNVLDILIKMIKGEWHSSTHRILFEGFGK